MISPPPAIIAIHSRTSKPRTKKKWKEKIFDKGKLAKMQQKIPKFHFMSGGCRCRRARLVAVHTWRAAPCMHRARRPRRAQMLTSKKKKEENAKG
jgi:hypothetical protein